MTSIHTNVSALNAQKNMPLQSMMGLDEAMERLSSGLELLQLLMMLPDLLLLLRWKHRLAV